MSIGKVAPLKKSADVDMTEGNIAKHLITFALPLIFGNLFQMLYNMVDTWVVGNYVSDTAFSAVGTLASVTNLMIGFFTGLAGGVGVIISQHFGAGNNERVKRAVHTAATLTLILCVVFTALGLILVKPFMVILKMPSEVEPEAVSYLSVWFTGISSLMIYNMGSGIMRAVGDSRRPFYFLVVSAIINTVLDLLLVLVFDMGVVGVALATVIAQTVSALMVIITLMTANSAVRFQPKAMCLDRELLGKIIRIGIPTALQMSITSFSNIFVQSYINFFGKECMGGWTAYSKIDQIVLLPMQSISLATTTFVGQNLGKRQTERADRGVNVGLMMSLASNVALILPIMLFAGFFVSIFNSSPEIIEYGTMFLHWLTPFYLTWCINQSYSGALRGSGNTTVPMIIMLSSFVVFRQVYLFVVSNFISNTILLIAMAFPAGWVLSSILTFVYYKKVGLMGKRSKMPHSFVQYDDEKERAE